MDNTETDARQQTYNTTRARLVELIDHPQKHLSIAEYRANLIAAQHAHDAAFNALYPNLAHGS